MKVALLNFETSLKESLSEFIGKLEEKNLPRSAFNKVLDETQNFVAILVEGLKTTIGPDIEVGKESLFNDFIAIMESSLRDIESHHKVANNVKQARK